MESTLVGLNILSIDVFDAIGHFNKGSKATLHILKELNIKPGFYTTKISVENETRSVTCQNFVKREERVIRQLSKKTQDTNIEDEGTSYEAGGF